MDKPSISIVIPLYNNEKYIARAIESCLNQTFQAYEIIIIDDCSSDTSLNIANSYATAHSQITTIANTHNQGTFTTRIIGAKQAKGDYICFLDSDDHFAHNALYTLYQKAHEQKADIVYANYYKQERISESFKTLPHLKELHHEQIFQAVFDSHTWTGSRWTQIAKLYSTALIHQSIQFLESLNLQTNHLIRLEDLAFSAVILFFAKKATILNEALLYISIDEKSTTRNQDKDHRKKLQQSDQKVILLLQEIAKHPLIATHPNFAPLFKQLLAKISYEFYANQRCLPTLLTLNNQEINSCVYAHALIRALRHGNHLKTIRRLFFYMISLGRVKK